MPTGPHVEPGQVDLTEFDLIIDVRPGDVERATIPGSVHVPLNDLLGSPGDHAPSLESRILVVCDIGMRSLVGANALSEAGYRKAVSLAGGIDAWRRKGLPLEGTGGLTAHQLDRFDRQIKLPDIGPAGQRRLLDAHVTVVGAGGLGVPVLTYLAAAGIGALRIIDPDIVDLSNLQRQPIYRSDTVGEAKAPSAAAFIAALTPETRVETRQELLTSDVATSLLAGTDIVVDATDSFDARYAINGAAIDLAIPMISGAVYRWEGQLTTLEPSGPCYRCVFPSPPGGAEHMTCELIGAMGSVVATIGTMQATEVIAIAAGAAPAFSGVLGMYDGRRGILERVRVAKRADCPACS